MADSSNIPLGLKITTQLPLDAKTIVNSEAILSDLGFNNNLAFTYYDGMVVTCQLEKTDWQWREVVGLETGLLATNFTYPDNIVANGITYSLKSYNFFEKILDISGKENTSNKQNSLTTDGSGAKFPTVDAINNGVVKNFIKSDESLSLAKRKDDVIYGILDQYTGEQITLSKVTGTPAVDNVIYFQLGAEYFKRNFDFVKPEWFGLDGVNDQIAINKALSLNNSILPYENSSISVFLEAGKEYYTSAPIRITKRQQLIGNGAMINSTSTTTIIEGIPELLSDLYQHSDIVVKDVVLESYTALTGIDLMGFTHSKMISIEVRLLNATDSTIGIALRHGGLNYQYCYFNEINNCKVKLISTGDAVHGTGISIKGVDGVSGANVNYINGGVVSGFDKYGLTIDNLSYENRIDGLDFEHWSTVDTFQTIAVNLLKGNLNSVSNSNIENYKKGIIVNANSHGNLFINMSTGIIPNEDNSFNNNWTNGQQISLGSPITNDYVKIRASAYIFPTIRIDSKYNTAESRNWSLQAGFSGSDFSFRRSLTNGADPIDGTAMWEINEQGSFVLPNDLFVDKEINANKAVFNSTIFTPIVIEASDDSGFRAISIKGGTLYNALLMGQYADGKAIIYNQANAPTAFYTNSIERGSFTTDGFFKLETTPTTSAGTYDIITRNTTTGVVEKKASTFFATDSNVVHKTGDETIGGSKEFTSVVSALGLTIDDGGSNNGITITNNLAATGIIVNNTDTATGVVINNATGATGIPFSIRKNAVDKLTILDNGLIMLGVYTVATLPTPATTAYATVTDATAPTYLGALTGGGAVVCPVFYNGTIWVSH